MSKKEEMIMTQAELMKLIEDQHAKVYDIVLNAFNGDDIKATQWMKTKSPTFLGLSPSEVIMQGDGQHVINFLFNYGIR